jgi:hypothetical protein
MQLRSSIEIYLNTLLISEQAKSEYEMNTRVLLYYRFCLIQISSPQFGDLFRFSLSPSITTDFLITESISVFTSNCTLTTLGETCNP